MNISESKKILIFCLSSYTILVLIVNLFGIFWPAFIILETGAPSALVTLFVGLFGTVIVDYIVGLIIIELAEKSFEIMEDHIKNDCMKYMTGLTCAIVVSNFITFLAILDSFNTIL
ncbi:MAG: hypothetical protein ABGU93_07160 [Acetobacterium sp.]|uniref:hypothetical protein n=1 Tax=Acetobacterium sp. TaxID=1872094 RepID=UPI003242D3EF